MQLVYLNSFLEKQGGGGGLVSSGSEQGSVLAFVDIVTTFFGPIIEGGKWLEAELTLVPEKEQTDSQMNVFLLGYLQL